MKENNNKKEFKKVKYVYTEKVNKPLEESRKFLKVAAIICGSYFMFSTFMAIFLLEYGYEKEFFWLMVQFYIVLAGLFTILNGCFQMFCAGFLWLFNVIANWKRRKEFYRQQQRGKKEKK